MDPRHFDALSRVLATVDSRRSLVAFLALPPVLGGLLGSLFPKETEAGGRRKRRKKAHKHGKGRRRKKHKQKPQCSPTTCVTQGKTCGEIPDGCGGTLQCGTCANPTPVCNSDVCTACTNASQCGTGAICCGGSCTVSTAWSNQTTFGSAGSGASEFSRPQGIAVASDHLTAWVADTNANRVSIWTRPNASSTAWSNQTTFGSSGSGGSEFSNPQSVAAASDTLTAWVADSFNNRISVWTRPAASSTAWTNQTTFGSAGTDPSQFQSPRSVAVASDTLTAWVADTGNHRISVWTRPNASSTAWTNQTSFGSSGSGGSEFSNPVDVALSSDQLTAWVADAGNNRISVWTRPNTSSTAWTNQTTFGSVGGGPNQFLTPFGVAVASDTLTVWVADSNNDRISVWTRPTASSTAWTNQTTFGSNGTDPSQFQSPRSVAVASEAATAWVVDNLNNRIAIWGLACPA